MIGLAPLVLLQRAAPISVSATTLELLILVTIVREMRGNVIDSVQHADPTGPSHIYMS